MHSAVLKTQSITKSFGHIIALRGISLAVQRGSITAVVGDNGSGKSTLIKIISGMLVPDSGSIVIDGRTVSSLTAHKAIQLGVRTVYQDLALDNCKNSIENIFLGAEILKGPFLYRRAMEKQGGYIPFDWKKDFTEEYLDNIKFYCLVMSENYIKNYFDNIKKYASAVENRIDDDWCAMESVLEDNAQF